MFNQMGFSIAQVVVAMSIMSAMSLGLTSMIQNQSNTVFYLEDKMSHQNLKKEVENLLNDSAACTESLTNITVPTALLSASPNASQPFIIKDKAGAVVYDVANTTRNKFDRLNISNIKIQNVDISGAATTGKINIVMDVRRQRGPANTNQALQSVVIQKEVTIDGTRNVTGCVNTGDDALNSCLTNFGGRNFGGSNPTSVRIPADAKVIKVTAGGSSCSGSGGGGAGNRWSGSVAPMTVTVQLNGKNSVNNRPLVGGGNVSLVNIRGRNQILYNNAPLIELERCSENSNVHTALFSTNIVPTCNNTGDFRSGAGIGFGTAPNTVTYWK